MSDENDIIFEDGEEAAASHAIEVQVNLLFNLNEMDHSGLYDDWQEQKIKVISRAMKIIMKAQDKMSKEL